MANNVEHLFMCLFAINISSLLKCLFFPFLIELFGLFLNVKYFTLLKCNSRNVKLTILSEQFSGIYCIHNVVQSPSLSSSKVCSSTQKETSYPLNSSFTFSYHSQTLITIYLCHYGFTYSNYIIYMEAYNMWNFVSGWSMLVGIPLNP